LVVVGKKLEERYRTEGSMRVWDKTIEEMSVIEMHEYMWACQVQKERIQALLYEWSTMLEPLEVPIREVQTMVEDVTFLASQVEAARDKLERAVHIDNTDGWFLVNVAKTVVRMEEVIELLDNTKSDDEEEAQMIEAELLEARELHNYWGIVLQDHMGVVK
jgi:hypothetical protein